MELLMKGTVSPIHTSNFQFPVSPAPLRLCVRILSVVFVVLLAGCSSIVQKGGEILDGSAFKEMELGLYRSSGKKNEAKIELRELRQEDGNIALEISSGAWPGLALRGGRPGGSGIFELREARILSSHVNGWNEFTLDILGKAVFNDPKQTGGVLYIPGDVERVQISSGNIRLKSDYLSGTAALTPLRNRRERILALIEWMDEKIENSGEKTIFPSQKEFEKYWKSRLFPELVSKKQRPPEYSAKNTKWKRADSVKWNLTYTEHLFPEELWEYRNSGALLRDWEEALYWIYIEYSWNYVMSSLNNKELIKIK